MTDKDFVGGWGLAWVARGADSCSLTAVATWVQTNERAKWAASWQNQQNDCEPSKDSDQPGHLPSLIRVVTIRMKKAWVLSYRLSAQRRLLIRLGGCPGWSESSLGSQSFCWFCHEAFQMLLSIGLVGSLGDRLLHHLLDSGFRLCDWLSSNWVKQVWSVRTAKALARLRECEIVPSLVTFVISTIISLGLLPVWLAQLKLSEKLWRTISLKSNTLLEIWCSVAVFIITTSLVWYDKNIHNGYKAPYHHPDCYCQLHSHLLHHHYNGLKYHHHFHYFHQHCNYCHQHCHYYYNHH